MKKHLLYASLILLSVQSKAVAQSNNMPNPKKPVINHDHVFYAGTYISEDGPVLRTFNGGKSWMVENDEQARVTKRAAAATLASSAVHAKTDMKSEQTYQIFPNPTTGITQFTMPESEHQGLIKFYDVLGRLRMTSEAKGSSGSRLEVDLRSLDPGSYQVVLEGERVSHMGAVRIFQK